MNRSVLVYGLLLVAALAGAFLSWTSDPTPSDGKGPVIASIQRSAIEKIRYETDAKTLVLEPRTDDRGESYVWVRETKKATEAKASASGSGERSSAETAPGAGGDAASRATGIAGTSPDAGRTDAGSARKDASGAAAGPPAETAGASEDRDEPKRRVFLADEVVDQLFGGFAPLRAVRRLEADSKERLRAYGLAEPRGTLEIRTTDGRTRTFAIGETSYGQEHVYLRDQASGESHAVEAEVLAALRYSDVRLFEQDLTTIPRRDIESIVVRKGGAHTTLHQHNAADLRKAFWSIGDRGDKSKGAGSWTQTLLRLQAQSYHPDPPAGLETVMTVQLRGSGEEQSETVEFFKTPTGAGETEWYARSGHTRFHVRLESTRASVLARDADRLVR